MKTRNIFVTFILVSVVLCLLVSVSSATWCDNDYAKRINVSVNNTAGSALTDYQVYVNLSSNPINETSLRVYNDTSCTLRSHWCENITNGNCTKLWINYSNVAVSTWTNNTAIYYNNIVATSTSDGDTTFLLFDDFQGTENDYINFSRDPYGAILERGGSGEWDDYEIREKVALLQEDGIIHIWYCGRGDATNDYDIGYANSSDGTNFTKYATNPVLNTLYREQDPCIVKNNSIYYLYIEHDDKRIDRYNSSNKVTWTFEQTTTGLTGKPTSPVVWIEDSTWHLLYEDFDPTPAVIRYANSSDGLSWTNDTLALAESYDTIPDSVIKVGSLYHLYYHSAGNYKGVWHATSTNLTTWTDRTEVVDTFDQYRIESFVAFLNEGELWTYGWWINEQKYYLLYGFELNMSKWSRFTKAYKGFAGVGKDELTLAGTMDQICSSSVRSVQTFTNNIIIETKRKQQDDSNYYYIDISLGAGDVIDSDGGTSNWWHTTLQSGYLWRGQDNTDGCICEIPASGGAVDIGTQFSLGSFSTYRNEKYVYNSSGWLGWYIDNILKDSVTNTTFLNNNKYILLSQGEYSNDNGGFQFIDWVFVRKYAPLEPSTTLGNEEQQGTNPILHIDNAINIKEDWSRDFNSNISANVTVANASGVWMNFSNAEFTNTSLGWLNLTLDEWVNESHNVNSPVTNISVDVYLNSTTSGTTNDSDNFYYEITKRTNTATMDSTATQNVNTSETFYVNATCNEEYSDTFLGAANLLEDGAIVDTDTTVTNYVNFSHSESSVGQYNYTVRFYNLTHYDNVTTPTYSNVTISTGGTTPSISNVMNGSINSTAQWINWTVNQSCSNRIKYWYREEDANEVSCSGSWNVSYPCANTYDANWSSYGTTPTTGYVYFNYSIPLNASRTLTKWYGKDQHIVGPDNMGYPYTIPLLCWNSPLRLRVEAYEGGVGQDYVSWQCHNGTGWEEIEKNQSYFHKVYEERMEWVRWSNWQNGTATPNITLANLSECIKYHFQVFSYNTTDSSLYDNSSTYDFTKGNCRPPIPVNLQNNTGNFWINHTWSPGSGNLTNSYNVSIGAAWHNTTTTTYHNDSALSAHDWSNVTVWAYNTSGNGSLSTGNISDNVRIPNNVPVLTGLPDNTTDEDVNRTDIFDLDDYFTDVDSDTPTYLVESNNQSTNVSVTINASNNVSYTLASGWNGTASVVINVTDGWGGEDNDTFLIIVNAPPLPGDYIPGDPTTLQNTTGNYWVNYTWIVGGGNVTDSYNVSWNATWYNNTLTTYMQKEVGASNWGNITVYAYNASGNGSLSAGYITDNVQAPAYVPGDYIPADPTTLQNTTGNYWVNYTWVSGGGANITDSYNVSWNLTWYNNTLVPYMNDSVGAEGWANITVSAYNSSGNGSLSAGYISDEVQAPTAPPGDYPPATPTTLANTTGNGWVNYTWNSGGGANVTDSYNVSWNLTWYNTTIVAYMNDSVGEFGWANISVWAYNTSGNGSLSPGSVSDNTQAGGGTYITSMTTTVYNLITYYGSSSSSAEQFGIDIGSVDYIAMYNGSFYSHTMGFVANNFTVYHGIGYYVYLNVSGSSTYQRNNISDSPYNTQLYNRWNTVGWTNSTDTNAEGVAASIGSACKYTSSLNADGITYATHTVGFTSNNHAVEKGEGYWVWVNTGVSWGRNN